MVQSFMQSKPTCGTCPFFHRLNREVGGPGECHREAATPVPVGQNPQGGFIVGAIRPPTRHDLTCSHHPRMAAWIARHYADDETTPDYGRERDAVPDAYEHEAAHAAEAVADEAIRKQPMSIEGHGNHPSRIVLK